MDEVVLVTVEHGFDQLLEEYFGLLFAQLAFLLNIGK